MSEESNQPVSEVEKRLKESYGLWMAYEKLQKVYPAGTIVLMGPSAPCDFLVVDKQEHDIVAVEVKASGSSSAANRGLTKAQREFGLLLESSTSWKAELKRYVMYGEPGKDARVEEVPWNTASPGDPAKGQSTG